MTYHFTFPVKIGTLVFRYGSSLSPSRRSLCEPRQVRKEAAVALYSRAEMWLLEPPPNPYFIMTYIALARKWRPRTFSELLGQEHLTRALTQSLVQNRVHHAYLFTGTRGVGKTSVARILAKALNCEQGVSAQPCLQCEVCQAIEQGRFVDLIEIDAASKTRVEDTRDLLDNVQYAPTIGRFKVYLIDEVHMLSQHSFNALLKTLEEPPTHVKFLLATTDVQKIPITILSRCLQFHLKHVAVPIITQHLQTILQTEQVTFEPAAIDRIAQAARGSMRDALSLLDQCLAGRTDILSTTQVAGLLGQTTETYALQLLQALCANAPQQLIEISRKIAQTGEQFRYVLEELLRYLHRIAVLQALPNPSPELPNFIDAQPDITLFTQQLSAEDTQLCYQIGLKGLNDLPFAPSPLIGFEMTLLRMYTFKPAGPAVSPTLSYQQPQVVALIPEGAPSPETVVTATIPDRPKLPEINHHVSVPPPTDWATTITQLQLNGLALSALQHTELLEKKANELILKVEKAHQSIFTKPVIARIQDSLSTYYQETISIVLQYQQDKPDTPAVQKKVADSKQQDMFTQALHHDPVFQQLQKEFSAVLVQDSIVATEK